MGLDDAEIYMDLEDEFLIRFEAPNKTFDGTVGAIVDYIKNNFTDEYFTSLRNFILNFKLNDENNVTKSEFNSMVDGSILRKSGIAFNRTWPKTKDDILVKFDERVSTLNLDGNVEEIVIGIIKKRLGFTGEILLSHHLYKDLGAG